MTEEDSWDDDGQEDDWSEDEWHQAYDRVRSIGLSRARRPHLVHPASHTAAHSN